jgi:hypothetical protein
MYENAQWIDREGEHIAIRCDINGVTSFVPLDPANTDYQNLMRLQEEGKIVIAPASADGK